MQTNTIAFAEASGMEASDELADDGARLAGGDGSRRVYGVDVYLGMH